MKEVGFISLDKIKSKEIVQLLQALRQELPDLKCLTVNSCKVKKLPGIVIRHLLICKEDLGKLISPLKSLRTIRLENNSIAHLPDSLQDLTALQEVSFNGNKLTEFPKPLNNLIINSLMILDLGNNQLESLSNLNPVGSAALETFRLRKNLMTEFPLQLVFLKNSLKYLDLSDNQISSLPNEFSQLENLQHLLLRGNKFTVSPRIKGMKNLEILDLSENQLQKLIPETVKECPLLKKLELQHNKLENIPGGTSIAFWFMF